MSFPPPYKVFSPYVAGTCPSNRLAGSQQKLVLRVPTMTDDKVKQKAIEAVADIYGNALRLLALLLG
jgi:hypothetical protein